MRPSLAHPKLWRMMGLMAGGLAAGWLGTRAVPAYAALHGTVKLAADADEHDFVDLSRYPIHAAVNRVLKKIPGPVLWVGLENLDGYLYYAVQIAGNDGSLAMVSLDAGSGKINEVERRTAAQAKADADKEAAADAAKAKADPNSEEARKAREAAQPDRGPVFKTSITVPVGADQWTMAKALRISVFAAMTAARSRIKGKIASVSLAADHGFLYYAVTIKEASGRMTLVAVDAGTAAVVGTEEGG